METYLFTVFPPFGGMEQTNAPRFQAFSERKKNDPKTQNGFFNKQQGWFFKEAAEASCSRGRQIADAAVLNLNSSTVFPGL